MDVLEAIHKGEEKPTRLMYKANLSWMKCHAILMDLEARGMVITKKIGKKRTWKRYRISERGLSTLKHYLFVQGRFR